MESIESVILTPSITNYHSEGPPIFNLKTKVGESLPQKLRHQSVFYGYAIGRVSFPRLSQALQ